MTDTPCYCPCGTRLGLRRSDGAFVSRHVGRTYVLYRAFADAIPANHKYDLAFRFDLTCEQCALTTPYDKLLDKPPDKG
jgi:hypothetical protein